MAIRPPALRRARPSDASELADLFIAARREALPGLDESLDMASVEPWLGTVIEDQTVWVSVDAQGITAFVAIDIPEKSLEHLYVRPEAQGSGIGTALVGVARDCVPRGLELWTFQRNTKAIGFYEALGFEEAERTDGTRNMEKEPDLRLVDRAKE